MAVLKTDSPLSRRIVRAFLDFLDSVEAAPGVDLEGLDVAKECLTEVFQLNPSPSPSHADEFIQPGLLINLFRSLDDSQNVDHNFNSAPPPPAVDVNQSQPSRMNPAQGDSTTGTSYEMGESKDELFGQFFAALEKIHFFRSAPDGNDDPVQLDKATRLFHDAISEMDKAGCQSYNRNSLAETLKSQGNQALQSKRYSEAVELYSCAIALCENNAVYYCNRAAAYSQIDKYNEAIRDCLKTIEIDPHYSKAYSRLGFAYYALGNYRDAIDKGFRKALQLDPNNESIKENIRVAEQKLKDGHQGNGWDQMNFPGHDGQDSNNQVPPFPSMSFNANGIPVDFTNMFRNMTAQFTGQHPQEMQGEERNSNGHSEPNIGLGGNINLNIGENMPEELRGALRSVMGMFTGATAPNGNPQQQDTNSTNGTPPTN